MIVLCITNRPHFAPFLWEQLQKMNAVSITPVIYQNGEPNNFWHTKDVLHHYRSEWKNQADCFNAFRKDYATCSEHLLVWDDDIFIDHDFTPKYIDALENGYDRVCNTVSWFYHLQEKQDFIRVCHNWQARKVGVFAMHQDLWKRLSWPSRPKDPMLPWFNNLGPHNVRQFAHTDYTHLVHTENSVIRSDVFGQHPQDLESMGAKHPLVLAVDQLNGCSV